MEDTQLGLVSVWPAVSDEVLHARSASAMLSSWNSWKLPLCKAQQPAKASGCDHHTLVHTCLILDCSTATAPSSPSSQACYQSQPSEQQRQWQ
jgi:hypothetical protein